MDQSSPRRQVTPPFAPLGDLQALPDDHDEWALTVLAPLRARARQYPADAAAHLDLAEALRQAGRIEQAVGAYVDTINSHSPLPVSPAVYIHLITALQAVGRDEQALYVAQQGAGTCDGEPGYWLAIGHCHAQRGEYPVAVAAYERCLLTPPTPLSETTGPLVIHRDAHIGLSQSHAGQSDPLAAARALMNAEWIAGDHWQVWQARLRHLLSEHPFSAVAERVDDVLARMHGSDRRQLSVTLAGALWLWGRADEAQALLEQAWATAIGADAPAALVDVAEALMARGDPAAAVERLGRHRSLPGIPEALAIALFRLGQWPALAELCDTLWEQPGSRSFAATYRGIARMRLGDFDGAEADCRAAVAGNPENIGAWHNLGLLAISRERFGEAKAAFLEVIERHRLDAAAPVNLARIALMEGDSRRVEHWLAEALNALPPALSSIVQEGDGFKLLATPELSAPMGWHSLIADLYAIWGSLLLSCGDKELGVQRLSLAALLAPGNGNHHLLIGIGLIDLQAPRLARRFFSAAVARMPRSRTARARLTDAEALLSDQASLLAETTQARFQYLDDLIATLDSQGDWL
ncbi:MAG: tetratricopeptide repeat protein [Candidatus Sericytochromatia bacterium]|nr:tetratricopeptide repeat protein [Candidatus Sericytochromatia bacterium]